MTKEETKQLVENIFGSEAANDDDIVDFYFNVNSVAMDEFKKQQCIEFIKWFDEGGYDANHLFTYEQLVDEYLQSKKIKQ